MANRAIELVEGEYYHVYNRGNDKRVIFHDDNDKDYFKKLLTVMNNSLRVKVSRFKSGDNQSVNFTNDKSDTENHILVSIGSYCLMPNHFHILIKQEYENGISLFMQKVTTAYVMYYNKKYKKTGGLCEGAFKSKYAGVDTYLKYLFAYIHLNPLKLLDPDWKNNKHDKQKVESYISFLLNYKHSSFPYYFNGEEDETINKEAFPDYFPTREAFISEIFSWISDYKDLDK